MNYITLDKSYLQKVKRETLAIIAATNRIVVPDVLIYEISTSKDIERSISCFKKLLFVKNDIDFLPHSGVLIKYEIENKRACLNLSQCFYPKPISNNFWQFVHNCIKNPSKEILNSNVFSEMYHNYYEVHNVNKIMEVGNIISRMFPELKNYKSGSKKVDFKSIKKKIVTDYNLIKHFIKDMVLHSTDNENSELILKDYVDEKWVFFKSFQAHLVYYIFYIEKYGDHAGYFKSKKLPHDSLDLEYAITGIISGRIATSDNLVKELFCMFHSSDNCVN